MVRVVLQSNNLLSPFWAPLREHIVEGLGYISRLPFFFSFVEARTLLDPDQTTEHIYNDMGRIRT